MELFTFTTEKKTVITETSKLVFVVVTATNTELDYNDQRGQNFLYDDIMSYGFSPRRFIEILHIEVDRDHRRCGVGSKLIGDLMDEYPNLPIFVKAGILDEHLYELLRKERKLKEYIYENIVPFYERNGFADVNDTSLGYQEFVIMCYPESLARQYIGGAAK